MTAPAVNEWRVASALVLAQLEATLVRLDAGTGNAKINLYKSVRQDAVGAGIAPMAEIVLAKPSGTVSENGLLELIAQSASGVMVLESGIPRWGELVAADGTVLTDGGVTDVGHDGCFQVAGGQTPEGDNSPMFYAGGLITLAGTALG